MVAILINTVILACYYFMIPDDELELLNTIDGVFIAVFTIETIMKIIA